MTKPAALPPRPTASRLAACLGSLLLPGAVHFAYGQRAKGIVLMMSALVTCWGLGLLAIAAAVDAVWLAGRLAAGEPVGAFDSSPVLDWIHRLVPDDLP